MTNGEFGLITLADGHAEIRSIVGEVTRAITILSQEEDALLSTRARLFDGSNEEAVSFKATFFENVQALALEISMQELRRSRQRATIR